MSKVIIRGHEFDIDLYDLDQIGARAQADALLGEGMNGTDLISNPTYEGMVAVFGMVAAFFDTVLGEGSLLTILNGRRDVADALDAYYDFRDALLDASLSRAAEIARRAKLPEKYRLEKMKK